METIQNKKIRINNIQTAQEKESSKIFSIKNVPRTLSTKILSQESNNYQLNRMSPLGTFYWLGSRGLIGFRYGFDKIL